ncbi:class I SAM-dependent methyltransferase [Metallosphaera javensis (ex Sakai et al. 2022)]|uniref:class I SAM-dependent methyltransferase n=1 Tax=Metallosphaera javensis (ex Sakai et al. 2022) TaxID=2775498 RepID=UPI0025864E91|nr:MAG: uncharacterized SAM-dependent methyltransferase SSO3110 [Metallosphaera javensis (ex Sakai et al. 2022)]
MNNNTDDISTAMEKLEEVLGVNLQGYWREAKEISDRLGSVLGSSFPYALTERKRLILYSLVRYLDPEVAIETGVGPGVSTTMILSGLRKGILYSVDVRDILENGKPVGFLVPDELKGKWRLYIGRSEDVLPKLMNQAGKIDIFLHDSEHTYENVMFELRIAWAHLRQGGVLLIDNLDFTRAPRDFAKESNVKLIRVAEDAGGLGMILKR